MEGLSVENNKNKIIPNKHEKVIVNSITSTNSTGKKLNMLNKLTLIKNLAIINGYGKVIFSHLVKPLIDRKKRYCNFGLT